MPVDAAVRRRVVCMVERLGELVTDERYDLRREIKELERLG